MAQKVEVVLQPLYAPEAGRAGAVCSILKIDDATFMLDCGWDERMGSEALEPLKKCVLTHVFSHSGPHRPGTSGCTVLPAQRDRLFACPPVWPGLSRQHREPSTPVSLIFVAGFARRLMPC